MTALIRFTRLSCVILLITSACSKQAPTNAGMQLPPPEVAVITVHRQNILIEREIAGRLSAFRTADVRARVEGVVLRRLYNEGSDVKVGQALFQIDPAPLKAALAQAEGQLAAAQATYVNAKASADRARQLIPQQFISRSDFDAAQATERSSAAAVKQAQAAVDSAKINLGFTHVTSPISGRAANQSVTEGALVGTAGNPTLLTTVDQIDPLYINFSVNSDDWLALKQAQTQGQVVLDQAGQTSIQLIQPDGTPYKLNGTLDFFSATVDPATSAISLRGIIPNPERILLPGQFVRCIVRLGSEKNAFIIPSSGLIRDARSTYVYLIDANHNVQRRDVQAQSQRGNQWVISSGLEDGDEVVVDGIQKVHDGQPAKPIDWQPASAQTDNAQSPKN